MHTVIDDLGGPSKVARLFNLKAPSVIEWRLRGIPAERCPTLERASGGKYPCERLRPDVRWQRVPDPDWPHPQGRPCIDVAAPPATTTEAGHAA